MSTIPEYDNPPPRHVLPFDEWLQTKFGGTLEDLEEIASRERFYDETLATYAEYNFQVWEAPETWLLDRFSRNQIGRGLRQSWHSYMDPGVPRKLRNRGWEAIRNLFSEVFTACVSDCLAHLGESTKETAELDGACYMWWDISPYYGSSPRAEAPDHQYFLEICRDCLFSDRAAIQESAIHGLGEAIPWEGGFLPAETALDEFLASGNAARPELVDYARVAKTGQIQ